MLKWPRLFLLQIVPTCTIVSIHSVLADDKDIQQEAEGILLQDAQAQGAKQSAGADDARAGPEACDDKMSMDSEGEVAGDVQQQAAGNEVVVKQEQGDTAHQATDKASVPLQAEVKKARAQHEQPAGRAGTSASRKDTSARDGGAHDAGMQAEAQQRDVVRGHTPDRSPAKRTRSMDKDRSQSRPKDKRSKKEGKQSPVRSSASKRRRGADANSPEAPARKRSASASPPKVHVRISHSPEAPQQPSRLRQAAEQRRQRTASPDDAPSRRRTSSADSDSRVRRSHSPARRRRSVTPRKHRRGDSADSPPAARRSQSPPQRRRGASPDTRRRGASYE